jgi:asparagine synthase (glutamine-hydrolyzing)
MKDPYSHRDWKMAKLCNATSEEHAIHLEYLVASQIIRPLFADSEWQDETYPIMVDSIPASGTTMEKAMAQDMQLFLQEDIMTKVDRAAMFYSLETRAPFLDHSLMEWSLQTPDAIKYRNHQFKWPLKELLSRYVSRDIIDRPKKGFGVPIRAWLHGDFSEVVREIMDDSFIKAQGIFDNREIQRFYQRFLLDNNVILDKIMWSYMIFQLWYRQNCLHLA